LSIVDYQNCVIKWCLTWMNMDELIGVLEYNDYYSHTDSVVLFRVLHFPSLMKLTTMIY
jgi:hypothetical protein